MPARPETQPITWLDVLVIEPHEVARRASTSVWLARENLRMARSVLSSARAISAFRDRHLAPDTRQHPPEGAQAMVAERASTSMAGQDGRPNGAAPSPDRG